MSLSSIFGRLWQAVLSYDRYKPEDAEDPEKVGRLHRRVLGAMRELLKKGLQERVRLD